MPAAVSSGTLCPTGLNGGPLVTREARAHCFNKKTPACFDVAERSSRLETDESVYITLCHLISLRTGGEVDREEGNGREDQ